MNPSTGRLITWGIIQRLPWLPVYESQLCPVHLVASGGGNVIGGWVLQSQAKAPLLCCRVASSVKGPRGPCEATEVSRGQGGATVLVSVLGPLRLILLVPCGPAYAKPHDHFYPMTADLSVAITEWMSPVHLDRRSLLSQTQDHISSHV